MTAKPTVIAVTIISVEELVMDMDMVMREIVRTIIPTDLNLENKGRLGEDLVRMLMRRCLDLRIWGRGLGLLRRGLDQGSGGKK